MRRWQDSCDTQQWMRQHRPDNARKDDTKPQRYPQGPDLRTSLKNWRDWKEYQVYFQRGIHRLKERIEGARQAVEIIERKNPEVEKTTHKRYGHLYTKPTRWGAKTCSYQRVYRAFCRRNREYHMAQSQEDHKICMTWECSTADTQCHDWTYCSHSPA